MKSARRVNTGSSLAVMAGLALAAFTAFGQDFAPAGIDDDALPGDMETSVSSNPYVPAPGGKIRAEAVLATWEPTPRKLAQEIAKRYGPPDVVTPQALAWHHRAPWQRIVVREDAAPHNFPFQHSDWLEQTVSYRVPPAKFADLAAFDGSLLADRTRGELTARGGSEKANVIALNLADEIVGGRKSVAEARKLLAELLGKSVAPSPYAEGLKFDKRPGAPDADRAPSDSE